MNHEPWMIYGAYGYTGELIVREAIDQGRRPILAGRDEAKLEALAETHGLPFRAFAVDDAAEQLNDVRLVLHCAGPFVHTAEPMMKACLERTVHYLDITGEIPVFQAAHRRHQAAVDAGVVLCPGVGFDVVPTDCLATLLKESLPEATHLELAFEFGSLPSLGTVRTAIEHIGAGGLIREDGQLKPVRLGYRIRKIPFARGDLWAVSLPWGDVFTSQISTGIPNAIVYGAMPRAACWSMRLANPIRGILIQPWAQRRLLWLAKRALGRGPNETVHKEVRSGFWGRVTSPDGQERTATITGPSAYRMTAELAVAMASEVEKRKGPGGYFTASMLVGADFLSGREGYHIEVL
ncbi:MAG: saccharopine dehydrogenase NADP-binding domain-containing protein [Planctomycetia bacterium]|jgi:short subunit dehydrogenase-like uncharacterized protein